MNSTMTASRAPAVTSTARTLVSAASHAPSVYNTQPWRFRIHGADIDLTLDTRRILNNSVDPFGRQAIISCGAALFDMRVAANYLGRRLRVRLLPAPDDPTLLARVTIGPHELTPFPDAAMYPEIRHRHTYRRAFLPRAIPGMVIGELVRAAHVEHANLVVVGNGERDWLFDLVALASSLLEITPEYERDLHAWAGGHATRFDGIPVGAFGTMPASGRPPMRDFAFGDLAHAVPREHFRADPCIAVLSTVRDDRLSWLLAGQALQRILLLARLRGIAASFLNQPLDIEGIRHELFHFGRPQMILRLGYAGSGVATPRRPIDELVDEERPEEPAGKLAGKPAGKPAEA